MGEQARCGKEKFEKKVILKDGEKHGGDLGDKGARNFKKSYQSR